MFPFFSLLSNYKATHAPAGGEVLEYKLLSYLLVPTKHCIITSSVEYVVKLALKPSHFFLTGIHMQLVILQVLCIIRSATLRSIQSYNVRYELGAYGEHVCHI